MTEVKIKDTKIGNWLKEKSPDVFNAVMDSIPDRGVMGFIRNMVDSAKKDHEYYSNMLEAERIAQDAITQRWLSDNSNGSSLSKTIRPASLIVLLTTYLVLTVMDSISSIEFDVKDSYISLLEILSMTAFGAYFAGRSYEKTKL